MKVLLLDDEAGARATIKSYLQNTQVPPEEIREADSVSSALELLNDWQPDLALLDINLPDGLGFDVLARLGLDRIRFKVIFISAYDTYAIKAFKYNAIDYILKPVDPLEFEQSVARALKALQTTEQFRNLQGDFTGAPKALNKLVLKDHQSVRLVAIDEIVRCQSENNYTLFFLTSGEELLITRTLKEYEELLKGRLFFRPHKSHLINLKHLLRFDKADGGSIHLSDGSTVPLSRFKKEVFLQLLDQL
ncbi:LytR/AlgR family response regulator transcription factor [Marinoscillum furvescens]|uniref:LytTR family two component transcriptional regulator n=1 Tax=Marinoscillum furvescens DSM 4134 TaxID=1122208 RepID=A0A3D9L193_MARFU|nr:LytTR family DNA-binding domain-containing protein [Marinoscillum furvescens]RED95588.1 LytTR family two component transcriptional regulator [Marinoscillum furvescens DSM 4134]